MTLKRLYNHLVVDNPAWMYLNARAWRGFRRWGWFLVVPCLATLAFGFLADSVALVEGDKAIILIKLFPLGVLMLWVTALCVAGLKKLLHPHNVEPLYLSCIAPEQIWTAVMMQLNRNLLVVYCITLPIVLAPGPALLLPISQVLWLVVVAHCMANILGLACCVVCMQLGTRSVGILVGFIYGGYLILTGEESTANHLQPLIDVMNPIYHLFRLMGIRNQAIQDEPSLLGFWMPYSFGCILFFVLAATGLILWLISGPLHLPVADAEEIARKSKSREGGFFGRLFRRVGVATETSLASFSKPNAYTWRYTMSRIYENFPAFTRRRPYLWSVLGTTVVFWLVFLFLVDLLSRMNLHLFNMSAKDRSFVFALWLMLAGLIASFHFSFAGKSDQPDWPRVPLKARIRTFVAIMGPCLCVLFMAATEVSLYSDSHSTVIFTELVRGAQKTQRGINSVWHSTDLFTFPGMEMLAFVTLIVLVQVMAAIVLSLRSLWPRQAVGTALAHLLFWNALPFLVAIALVLVFAMTEDHAAVSLLSPAVALYALSNPDNFMESGEFVNLMWALACVLPVIEAILLAFVLLDDWRIWRHKQRAVPGDAAQSELQEVAKR